MTVAGWLLVGLLLVTVVVALAAVDANAPRLARPMRVAIVGAVILMAFAPHLWWVVYGVGMVLVIGICAAYLIAAVAAEIARWRELRQ